MEVTSYLQKNLENASDSLDKLRKEMLWLNHQQPICNPDDPIVITWEQMERLFSCHQNILNALKWNEESRIHKLMDSLR